MTIAHELTGIPADSADTLMVWGHGWRQDRGAFAPFAESLKTSASHLLLDFPGFGQSPLPPENWGTADYADAVAGLIKPYRSIKKIVWIGHSFGGRVGIQLASRHPELVDGLFLIATAGLPRQRSTTQKFSNAIRIYWFKILKHLAPLFGVSVDELRKKFGSADYRTAGALRPVFLRVIGENLTEQAKQIKCPAYLVYGADDKETPPDIGERLAALIPNAKLSILPRQDHYSVLGAGRHLVLKRLSEFMGTFS
jgi:pimeloyl-ACP methyl ester carboxylesterase